MKTLILTFVTPLEHCALLDEHCITLLILRRIGRGGGKQIINLQDPGCTDSGTIIHEFIHGWGFWHEHARPDRDNYVQILWENIIDDM